LRQRHAELAKLLVRSGDIDALEALASRWSSRDPLDPELLTARAAARAWRGDRNEALRILSGMLVAPGVTAERAAELASTLARAEERSSRPGIACALRFAAAESKPDDSSLLAPALACAQLRGDEARWLTASKSDADRGRLSAAVAKLALASRSEENLFGDIVVDATWDNGSGADLDIGVVDPSGKRLSWASTARVRARDCTSRFHEALAVSSSAAGAFVVDIVRSDGGDLGAAPVRGTLRITSQGVTKVVPFVLAGTRAPVARVDVRFESRLVPITAWDDGVPPGWTTPTPTPTSAPRPSLVLRGRDLGT